MKKFVCVLISAILWIGLLSACGDTSSFENNSESEKISFDTTADVFNAFNTNTTTESKINAGTTTTVKTAEPYQTAYDCDLTANSFLGYLKSRDFDNLCIILGIENKEAYSFFNDIKVDSYEITEENTIQYGMQYKVKLNISESSCELFPVGTSRWILEVVNDLCCYIELFRPADINISRITFSEEKDAILFCYRFSAGFHCYKTINDFNQIVPDNSDTKAFSYFCNSLIQFLPFDNDDVTGYEYKRDSIEIQAQRVLGITNVDFKKYLYYKELNDSLEFQYHGTLWVFSSLSSKEFDPDTKQYTIVIDYYSDTAYILKAKTMKYIVQENKDKSFTLLLTELMFDSGTDPLEGSI